MKRLLSIFLLVAMLASLLASCAPEKGLLGLDDYANEVELENAAYTSQTAWDGKSSSTSWYTNGSSPYTISNGADLKGFITLVANDTDFSGKTVQLKNDINLGDKAWSIPESTNYFKGTFDGKGYTIGGFTMTCDKGNQSLLGPIGDNAIVQNLNVEKGVITLKATTANTGDAAIVVSKITASSSHMTTKVINVTVKSSCKINYSANSTKTFGRVGGIVGSSTGAGALLIQNCTNQAAITGQGNVAGIIGIVTSSAGVLTEIKGCTNSGTITLTSESKGNRAAGIISDFNASNSPSIKITNCTNSGAIVYSKQFSGDSTAADFNGGIAGYFHGTVASIIFENCVSTGNITGANRTSGGIAGSLQSASALTIKDCQVNADMEFVYHDSKYPCFGGLVGLVNMAAAATDETTLIENCSVTGTLTIFEPHNKPTFVGGLIGLLRDTEIQVKGCTMSLEFFQKECETDDNVNVVLGGYIDSPLSTSATPTLSPTCSELNVTDLTYIHHNDIPNMDSGIDLADVSYFKYVGQQTKDNGNGTQDLRLVFGVGNIQASDKAIGFDVNIKKLGLDVSLTDKTVYCSEIYTSIVGGGKTYAASEFGCNYLFTLVIKNIPDAETDPDGNLTYIKNAILNITPFSQSIEDGVKHTGFGLVDYVKQPDRHVFRYEDFTPFLPEQFQGLSGVLSSKNVTYKTPNNVACQEYEQLGSNDQYSLNKKCTCNSACTCDWGSTGAIAYKNTPAMPYHYYIDIKSYTTYFGKDLDRYAAYHSWNFEVAEDGYYEFCFRIRVNGSDGTMQTRYALVQIDNESYGQQTEFYYNVAAQDGVLRDNGTNHDSYIVGFGRELKAGKHSITFRLPYDTEFEAKGSSFHIRDIFLLKTDRVQPAEADIPKLQGATLFDGNFDSAATYYLDNTSKSVLDAYRTELVAAGFELKEQRQTSYQFSAFDSANYKNNNIMYNDFYLYTNEDYMVYAYYVEGAKAIRVIVDYVEEFETYLDAHTDDYNAATDKVTTPMFALLDIGGKDITLTSGTNAGSKITGVTNGMCLVYRLSDGRFMVVDGGFWNEKDTEGEGVKRLYDWLQKNDHLEGENNKIVIANWIITHHHSDHISVAWKFDQMKKAGTFNVEVQNYMYNFPSYEYAMSVYGTNLSPSAYNMYYPNLHYTMNTNNCLVVHTGYTYQFADCSIEILHTHEDFYPEQIVSYNNSNTVFKITLAGKTFLVAGDLEEPGQKRAIKQSGTLLEADFLQMTHHGYNGQVEFYKYIVGANNSTASGFNEDTIIVCPLPKGETDSMYTGSSAKATANNWLKDMFRKENDQANDNMHFAIENWVFTDFN